MKTNKMATRKSKMAAKPTRKIKHANSNKLDSPHFYIIVSQPLEEGIKIPKSFMQRYGDSLQKFASLKAPTGSKWIVSLCNMDGGTWLSGKGLKEFGESFSIQKQDLLLFQYKGNSRFNVFIFDNSASEIDYPVNDQRVDKDGSYAKAPPPLLKKGKIPNDERAFESAFPSFLITLKKTSISHPYVVHLPVSFVRDNFVAGDSRKKFKVCVPETGKKWPVILDITGIGGRFSKIYGQPGWRDFVNDNGLKLGETCVFEMVKKKKIFNFYRIR